MMSFVRAKWRAWRSSSPSSLPSSSGLISPGAKRLELIVTDCNDHRFVILTRFDWWRMMPDQPAEPLYPIRIGMLCITNPDGGFYQDNNVRSLPEEAPL